MCRSEGCRVNVTIIYVRGEKRAASLSFEVVQTWSKVEAGDNHDGDVYAQHTIRMNEQRGRGCRYEQRKRGDQNPRGEDKE